ncbi:hypothetical protein AGMMS50256_38850 [Betaproteobacteria bacterium]|nr:hypothetical protein AGMMS50256_38850 [Betaproteobacteria bacterium]
MNIKNNIIQKLMIIILMLFANTANAVNGWLFAGQCFETNQQIQSAFEAMYPIQREFVYNGTSTADKAYFFNIPTNFTFGSSGSSKVVSFKFRVLNQSGGDDISLSSIFSYTLPPCVIPDSSDTGTSGDSTNTDSALLQTVANLQEAQAQNAATLASIQSVQQEPFDITIAWAAFSFFFSSVVLLWTVAKGGGVVLSAIRKG